MKPFCFLLTSIVLVTGIALAGKPVTTGGGGGGNGGGGGSSGTYSFVDLGGFTGGDLVQSWARDVNNPDSSGVMQIVGDSFAPIPGVRVAHAALWDVTADGLVLALTDIHPASYEKSKSTRINDDGIALVGGYVWVPASGLVTLPGLDGGNGSPGLTDDLGNVFGAASDADGVEYPVKWNIDSEGQITGPVVLGDLGDFHAQDINNHGVMAGYVNSDAAIAWFDDAGQLQVQILGTLEPGDAAQAVAINDNSMVAGNYFDPFGYQEAFVWTAETGMIGLGTLGGLESKATDINNLGQIVGWSLSDGKFPQVAFVWKNGQMFDLNNISDAGAKNWLTIASGINDDGHIVGLVHKTKPVSEEHGFLLISP